MSTIVEIMQEAVRHHQCGHLQEAERLYRLALQKNPENPFVLHSLGILTHQTGKHNLAVELINKAIAIKPQIAQFHNTLGLALETLGKPEEAVPAYQNAVTLKPDYAEAYHNMAIALQSQCRYSAAVEKCRQAISIEPDYAEAYNTIAFSLEKQQQYTEAIENYRQALKFKPDFAEAYNHLGVVLNAQSLSAEAIENYRRALQLDPSYVEVYNNLGIALKDQEQFTEAITSFRQALRLEPDFAEAHYNLANSLRDEGQCTQAIENYKQAIRIKPEYIEAHWNLSLTFLLSGNYIEGWKGYSLRRNVNLKLLANYYSSNKPRWDGPEFKGKRLLVHYEQGLGDNIQFARYLPKVKALGGTVIFEAPRSLFGLFKKFPGIDELIEFCPSNKEPVEFDVYTSLPDLPNIFGTTVETIPAEVPYIYADPDKAKHWQGKLAGPDLKVGIVWAGSPEHGNDRYRSCKLEFFEPLAKIDGVRLFGLQKGKAAAQMDELAERIPLTNISRDFKDFTDTAAAIENLDLIISVDTSLLHLAGAMGKQAWALLPFAPEWRWMLDREDSPWYPTMRLFRQSNWGRWDLLFQRVAEELEKIVKTRKKIQTSESKNNCKHQITIPIIIPYHKNQNQLARCISHLNNQTVEVDIFIRDNNNDNVYFTAAVNEGIKKYLNQPCKYILILNQDMYLEPLAVERMIVFMDSHPDCGIGAPLQLYSKNPDYVIFAGGHEAFPEGKHQHGHLSEFNEDEEILWCNGACMIIRKEMIQEIGLLDENFVLIGSDSDYCFTARSRGWQIWRIAGARGIHEYGISGLSTDTNIEILKIKDMIHFGKKWLTGDLYAEMAYEAKNNTSKTADSIMAQLNEMKNSLECRRMNEVSLLK